jgi:hypothetical protein
MTFGRTTSKFTRVYADGYDLSCYSRSIGPLSWAFEEGPDDPLCASVIGTWLGRGTISPGTLNGIFDNTSDTGVHALMKAPAVARNVMVPLGIQAVPAEGDPVFCGRFRQDDYLVTPADNPSALTIKFGPHSGLDTTTDPYMLDYAQPWGVLLHANVSTSDVNTSIGIDLAQRDFGTSDPSTDGGWMMYQVTAGTPAGGTAAIVVQDATTNENVDFATILSSGSIDMGTAPISGIVCLSTTASVKQFVRWNIVFGTATAVTFLLAFIRGRPRR